MDIGDYAELPSITQIPQVDIAGPMEHDYALIQGAWVQVIVTNVRDDSAPITRSEEKRAAFAATASTSA
jgi:hypothetical protein